jgi:signal transduction histidine kinase
MRRSDVEPELLNVFRWLVSARLVLSAITLALGWLPSEPRVPRYPLLGIAGSGLLLGYLSWPWLRERLGRAHLPPALLFASVGPILERTLTVALRLQAGVPPASTTQDLWLLIFDLAAPLILVSWQYNLSAVIAFCAGTALLEWLLYLPLAAWGGVPYAGVFVISFLRTTLYALVGYVIIRLVRGQREQQIALSKANMRLAHYATTLEQLAVSRERNRLARDLHDTLAHTLSGVAVQLEAARSLWEADPDAARDMLQEALTATRNGLGEARSAIQSLRTAPLEDLGLALAIRNLARSTAARANLALELQVPEDVGEVAPVVEQAVYRIADEAMTNVARHAQARDMLVRLERRGDELRLWVSDDGRGFDAAQSAPEGHYGLQGMRERAEMIGAELEVTSRPDVGTSVRLRAEVGM